jgi:hypothetical protein
MEGGRLVALPQAERSLPLEGIKAEAGRSAELW